MPLSVWTDILFDISKSLNALQDYYNQSKAFAALRFSFQCMKPSVNLPLVLSSQRGL